MNISNEVKVAILAIIAALLLYFGFNFLKGKNLFTKDAYYVIIYDRVEGLVPGNRVMLNGLQVGMVESVELNGKADNKIVTNVSINSNVKIPDGTSFQIAAADLLGEMQLELVLPYVKPGENVSIAESGDTLSGKIETGMMDMVQNELLPVKKQVEELVVSVDTLIGVVNELISSNRIQNILEQAEMTVLNLKDGSGELASLLRTEKKAIHDVLANSKTITDKLIASQDQIQGILNNADIASQKLAAIPLAETTEMAQQTILEAKNAITEATAMMAQLNNTDGTVGMLLNDKRLYENLNATAADLDKLLIDMRENPKSYVHFSLFGRKNKDKKKEKD